MAGISVCGVSKQFVGRNGGVQALENATLEIADGEFTVLVGPSGCGKSTLLNIIAGLDHADAGQVYEGETEVFAPGRSRSVVFQDGALFPWLTAQKNVEFGLKQMGLNPKERAERAEHYLKNGASLEVSREFSARTFRAACVSVWRLPAPSPSNRKCSSWTNRSPPSMLRPAKTSMCHYKRCGREQKRRLFLSRIMCGRQSFWRTKSC